MACARALKFEVFSALYKNPSDFYFPILDPRPSEYNSTWRKSQIHALLKASHDSEGLFERTGIPREYLGYSSIARGAIASSEKSRPACSSPLRGDAVETPAVECPANITLLRHPIDATCRTHDLSIRVTVPIYMLQLHAGKVLGG